MTSVEQIKLKRAGVGLRARDPELACAGYTLFAPMTGGGTMHLIDLHGQVVHTWRMPYPPGLYGYLTPEGRLFYCGKAPRAEERFVGWSRWSGGVALEADWDGNVLWEVRHPDHHHDARRLRNGNVLLLCATTMPRDLVPKVKGGVPGTEIDGDMWADYIVEMTLDGRTVWEWRSWEHLDFETERITLQDRRDEWTHGNSVGELPDGNIVASFRHISTVVIIDRRSGEIIWKVGPPILAQQHAPTPLPNGNLLIFDNGTHRVDQPAPFSRVIELDIATRQIVWTYQERRAIDFFSPYISNAQRLPNGNTLICEGSFGRLFEVTSDGRVVWEYVNPYFAAPAWDPNEPPSNAVFRVFRYSEEEVGAARDA